MNYKKKLKIILIEIVSYKEQMSAILHSIVTSIENDRIKRLLDNWTTPIKIAKKAKKECERRLMNNACCGGAIGSVWAVGKTCEKYNKSPMELYFPNQCMECKDHFANNGKMTLRWVDKDEDGDWIQADMCRGCADYMEGTLECDECDSYCFVEHWDFGRKMCGMCASYTDSDSD